jgi:uncharacterized protein YbbC (DUF1343 family)
MKIFPIFFLPIFGVYSTMLPNYVPVLALEDVSFEGVLFADSVAAFVKDKDYKETLYTINRIGSIERKPNVSIVDTKGNQILNMRGHIRFIGMLDFGNFLK